mgnify:CR=1 FL=1
MNKTFKQQIKDWWNENKKVIKTGFIFGSIGVIYGFAHGVSATNELWLKGMYAIAADATEGPIEDSEETDDICDANRDLLCVVNSNT